MKIIFKNLADDVNALVSVGCGEEISVSPLSDYELELDEKAKVEAVPADSRYF